MSKHQDELSAIKIELEKLIPIKEKPIEKIEDDAITVYLKLKSTFFRETIFIDPHSSINSILTSCYSNLLNAIKEHLEDPAGFKRKARKAFHDQWIDNIVNHRADANGETIPSNKQVASRLNNES